MGIQNGEVENQDEIHFLQVAFYYLEGWFTMNQFMTEKGLVTRLETAIENNDDISALLDRKVTEYREKNMPVESAIADYIFLGIQGQKDKIEQFKQYKRDLDEAIKEMQSLEKQTELEVFSWMEGKDIDKLKGIHCSSITKKEASVSVTNKIVRDITDAELLEKNLAHTVETIKDIPSSIKINARRAK